MDWVVVSGEEAAAVSVTGGKLSSLRMAISSATVMCLGLRNWFTPQLAKMKEMVMSIFNISQATEDPRDANNYKLAKINYEGALKQAKFHANQEFIQSSSNTCKAAWQIIKHETQPKQQHATPDADSFNEYFIPVVDEIREKIPAANTKPEQ
ncbi:hypothetical protein J6590_005432 [Homalodisca vitripennis]|nr:hypothetical protein J6590_005432 [Homalodisca vitripennis]